MDCPVKGKRPHLYPARSVPRPLPLVGSEHGDDFVQTALQTPEHFPRLPLLSAVHLTSRHVQRARPGDRARGLVSHRLPTSLSPSLHTSFSPSLFNFLFPLPLFLSSSLFVPFLLYSVISSFHYIFILVLHLFSFSVFRLPVYSLLHFGTVST